MTHLLADRKSVILGIVTNYIDDSKVKVTKENGILRSSLWPDHRDLRYLRKALSHIDLV